MHLILIGVAVYAFFLLIMHAIVWSAAEGGLIGFLFAITIIIIGIALMA